MLCRNKKIGLDMIGSDFYALQFLLKTSTQADYKMDKNRLLVQPGLQPPRLPYRQVKVNIKFKS